MSRQSIEPTYNRPKDGDQYSVTTLLGDRTLSFQKPIADPFIYTTVTVHWWDCIKSILTTGCVRVSVNVRGNRRIIEDVLELDADYLGETGCTRREAFNARINEALAEGAELYGLIHETNDDPTPMSAPKLSERLRELRDTLREQVLLRVPHMRMLDQCIAQAAALEAQVQGSSGQEGEGSGRSGAEPPSRDPALTGPNAQATAAGQSPSPGNAPTHNAIAAKAAKWDELAEAVGKFYDGDEPTGDLMDIGELCATKLGYL